MKQIQESIKDEEEVKSLRVEVSKGKGAISVLLFLGSIIAGVIGFKWMAKQKFVHYEPRPKPKKNLVDIPNL